MSGLSFVIPALNEERLLPRVLAAIRTHTPASVPYEVVVVDNGSTDGTADVARRGGASVISESAPTVAALRNVGVAATRFSTLVFLDADVEITQQWAEAIPDTLQELARSPATVTGSRCVPPHPGSWIERVWFAPSPGEGQPGYINSGHLIATRSLLEQVNGFNELLETGEDVDFCQRARAAGARIVARPELQAIHHGFPKSLREFFRREWWHGRGDVGSLRALVASKVALGAYLMAVLHGIVTIGLLVGSPGLAAIAGAGILGVCVAFAGSRRSPRSVGDFASLVAISYVYLWARALSPLRNVMQPGRWR